MSILFEAKGGILHLALPALLCTILPTNRLPPELLMRVKLAMPCIAISVRAFAQPSAQQSASTPTTLSGCMLGLNGVFSLTTANGVRYVLKGYHDALFSYNGKQVEVKRTMKATKKTSSKSATFQVTEVKKLADFCQ